ncbi:MAG: hypothetical protein QOI66_264 [Myxococcales bacterium]|jgi:hypothetical protein|nr:hypothetical protein [Myxococcales bacterium]
MTVLLERTRAEGCLSDLRLDQLVRDELAGEATATARAHLAGCAICRDALARIEECRVQFSEGLAGVRVAPSVRPPRRRRAWIAAGGGLLAAAAALLLVGPLRIPTVPWRSKGQGHLHLYVARSNTVRPSASGDVVAPGDRLQFTYTLAQERFFALLERDGRGAVNVFFPDGASAALLSPGVNVSLPRSTILDDVLGEERLYGLFCQQAVTLQPLRDALSAGRVPSAPDCETEAFLLEKRRP